MTQIVQHKSRDLIYNLSFPSDDSNLFKSIRAETDNAIYEVKGDNIATYSISAQGVTLSDISAINVLNIKKGQLFTVSVTKINSGIDASIMLVCRRQINFTNDIVLPSLNTGDGDFVYALRQGNVVDKISAADRAVIKTIQLPALPSGAIYVFMAANRVDNRIYVFGKQQNIRTTYALIIMPDDTILNFYEDAADTFSEIYTNGSNSNAWVNGNVYNHYLQSVFLNATRSGGGAEALRINLTDKSVNFLPFATPYTDFLGGVGTRINPVCCVLDYETMLGGIGYSIDQNSYAIRQALKETRSNARTEYIKSLDKTLPGSGTGFVRLYDHDTQVNDINISTSGVTGGINPDRLYIFNINKMISCATAGTNNNFVLNDFDTITGVGYQITAPPVSHLYIEAPVYVSSINKFCCKGVGVNVLYFIDPVSGNYDHLLLDTNIIYHASNCLQA